MRTGRRATDGQRALELSLPPQAIYACRSWPVIGAAHGCAVALRPSSESSSRARVVDICAVQDALVGASPPTKVCSRYQAAGGRAR